MLIVRDLTLADKNAWSQLYFEYFSEIDPLRAQQAVENGWRLWSGDAFLAVFKVCELDGQVAGIANAVLHDDIGYGGTACHLQDLYVAPALRRRGVARALLTWFREAMRTEGWTKLHWATDSANVNALKLYEEIAQTAESSVRYVVWGD